MIRMDEVNKIRKKFFVKGETRGKIAKTYRRSWDTVNRIVTMSRGEIENSGKRPQRTKSVMTDNVIKAITDIFDYEEATAHSLSNLQRACRKWNISRVQKNHGKSR